MEGATTNNPNPLEEISANILDDMSNMVKTEIASDNEYEDYSENFQDESKEEDHYTLYGSAVEAHSGPEMFKSEPHTISYESGYIPEVNYTQNYTKDVSPEVAKQRKRAREENSEPRLDCPVCADKVNGIHYGIYSCEGCKNFFKRSVTTNKQYTCFSQGNCDVKITVDNFGVKQTRKGSRCQACRLQACLDSGMVYLGYGYNRTSRKVRRSAFLKTVEESGGSPITTPSKKAKLAALLSAPTAAGNLQDATSSLHAALASLAAAASSTTNTTTASGVLDPLTAAQPTASGMSTPTMRITADSNSSANSPSSLMAAAVRHASPDNSGSAFLNPKGVGSRDSAGSILASMLKAPLKESGSSKGSKGGGEGANQNHSAFSGLMDIESGERNEEKDLTQLTKEQSDVVIVMLREQLKYERDKNRDLKKSLEAKSNQTESLEKQIHTMEKHSELTSKIIHKQKLEIERMKVEINRIGLFRNLLSNRIPGPSAAAVTNNGGNTPPPHPAFHNQQQQQQQRDQHQIQDGGAHPMSSLSGNENMMPDNGGNNEAEFEEDGFIDPMEHVMVNGADDEGEDGTEQDVNDTAAASSGHQSPETGPGFPSSSGAAADDQYAGLSPENFPAVTVKDEPFE